MYGCRPRGLPQWAQYRSASARQLSLGAGAEV